MLTIQHLEVQVDGNNVLHDVSLAIPKGEIHVLMGPNGSGKSTLSNTIAGHPKYVVTQGSIMVDDEDITHAAPDERAKKGVFLSMQYTPEIPGVTVGNFLRVAHTSLTGEQVNPLKYHKALVQQAQALGIDESFLSRSLGTGLSGGEKKRLEILQLLVLNPNYAILDETDSGLDMDALKIVIAGIKTFATKEKGILFITHYPTVLEYLQPNKVYVMKDGRIAAAGGKELADRITREGFSTV